MLNLLPDTTKHSLARSSSPIDPVVSSTTILSRFYIRLKFFPSSLALPSIEHHEWHRHDIAKPTRLWQELLMR